MRRLVTWLFIIASIFGMVVFYSYIVPVFKGNEEFVDSEVGDDLTGAAKTAYDQNMSAYDIIVKLSGPGFIIALIIFGLISMQKRERYEGHYGRPLR